MINAEERVDLSENVLHSDPFIDIRSIRRTVAESHCKTRHSDIHFRGVLLKTSSLLQQHSPTAEAAVVGTQWSWVCSHCLVLMLSCMLRTSFDIFAGHFGKVSSSLELPGFA